MYVSLVFLNSYINTTYEEHYIKIKIIKMYDEN